jgi:hypothetical protein
MTETAEPEVRYDPDGTADFTPDAAPIFWRTGTHRFQVISDPAADTVATWIARANVFARAFAQLGDNADEALAARIRQRTIELFEPVHTPEAQAAFVDAVEHHQIGLKATLDVLRWLPKQLIAVTGLPTTPPSDLSAGPPPPADGTSSTGGQPSTVSISGGSLSPGSSVSPGTP